MAKNWEVLSIRQIGKSQNWKDRMAGWHKFEVTYKMSDGQVIKETLQGRAEDVLQTAEQYGPDLEN